MSGILIYMKIALVHDYIKEYGGAERVLEALHEAYPDAPVFTLVYCPEFLGPHRKRFSNWDIRTSLLQHVPFKEKFISIFRLFAPFVFPLFTFSGYDVVLVSATGAYSPNMITKGTARQVCYYHTPPRYLYGLATAREWKKNPFVRLIAETLNILLRTVDKKSAQNVDIAIANSHTVQKRIKKFYSKDAVVIYPPVDVRKVSSIKYQVSRKYYVAGGRLARPKHYDLIIAACAQLHVPLKIFGRGFAGYEEELRMKNRELQSAAEFVGEVSDKEKIELMSHAKAFIMASEDEDFGITPVEAMGVGTPVIAYKSGGLTETVVDGKTGIFFDTLTVTSLVDAVRKFEKTKFSPDVVIKQAEKFSISHFTTRLQEVLQ